MNETEFMDKINKRVEDLFNLYPIEDLNPVQVQEEMKDGLKHSYAHRGMRTYLENAVKIAIKNLAIATTTVEIAYYKSRIDCLEQLLAKGKQCYTEVSVRTEMRKVGGNK